MLRPIETVMNNWCRLLWVSSYLQCAVNGCHFHDGGAVRGGVGACRGCRVSAGVVFTNPTLSVSPRPDALAAQFSYW